MHIIFQSVLMLFTQTYPNQSNRCLTKSQIAKVGSVFETECKCGYKVTNTVTLLHSLTHSLLRLTS